MHSRFGATTLQRYFGEQLWEAASGNRFGEQLWQAFRNNFEEQLLWRTAAFGGQLYKPHRGAALSSNFGEQLSGRFGEQICRIAAVGGNSFGEQLWRTALGNNFGEQLRGTALGSSFGQLSGTALRNTCFEEQQLLGIYLQGTSGSSFQSQLWVGSCFREHFWEQLWGPALWLWRAALGQIRGLALESSGEQLCEQLSGATALRSYVRAALDDAFWEQFSGRSFGKPLWEALFILFGSNFGEHLVICEETRASDGYCRLLPISHIWIFSFGTCGCWQDSCSPEFVGLF